MNLARQASLILLALLVVAFALTWLTLPTRQLQKVDRPASFFARGLTYKAANPTVVHGPAVDAVQREELEQRVLVIFASAAAVVVLVGLALGAARR